MYILCTNTPAYFGADTSEEYVVVHEAGKPVGLRSVVSDTTRRVDRPNSAMAGVAQLPNLDRSLCQIVHLICSPCLHRDGDLVLRTSVRVNTGRVQMVSENLVSVCEEGTEVHGDSNPWLRTTRHIK